MSKDIHRFSNKNKQVFWDGLSVSNDKIEYHLFPTPKGMKKRIYSIQFRTSTLTTSFTAAATGKAINVIQEIREIQSLSTKLRAGGESNKFAFCRHYENVHGNYATDPSNRYINHRFNVGETWLFPKGIDIYGHLLWVMREGGASNADEWAVDPIFSVMISFTLHKLSLKEKFMKLFATGILENYL